MKNKGFTLVELMVTITIMLIMTATVFFNYNKFNESSLLNAFAYDMSLTIRQAQVYGGAVKEGVDTTQSFEIDTDSAELTNFSGAYGVHFTKTPGDGDFPLKLYVDADKNGLDVGEVVIQSYKFQRGIKIDDICVADVCGKTNLDIVFARPDPEATMFVDGMQVSGKAEIILKNADQDITKSVIVEPTGQISVQ